MKTFIKWPGNKQKHLRHIIPHIPQKFNHYIEPFLGSGSLYLYLQPKNSILNDCNKDLIDIWNLVKSDVKYIIRSFTDFEKQFVSMDKQEKILFCREITTNLNTHKLSRKRSVNLLLMIFCAYMGIIVINDKYRFQGLEKRLYNDNKYYFLTPNYYNRIQQVSQLLCNTDTIIYNKDYSAILELTKKNDFVFLDPPYLYEYNVGFNYNRYEKVDLPFVQHLLLECEKLDKKNVKWLMTQADTKTIKNLFKKYTIIKYRVYRPIKKQYTYELIIKNY